MLQSLRHASRHLARALAVTAIAGASLGAQTINFADFLSANPTDFQMDGNAFRDADKGVMTLTPAAFLQGGSMFTSTAMLLDPQASFSAFFAFQIRDRGGLGNGADGFTFALKQGAGGMGGRGGGLGYSGLQNSMAVEFDTYDNGDESGGSNHVGFDLNGSINSVTSTQELRADFDDGNVWYAWVDYNGENDALTARWSQQFRRPDEAMLSYTTDLTKVFGSSSVYVGFTAGTGSGWGRHDILSWRFANEYAPFDVTPQDVISPEPATWTLLAGGLAALALVLRRRRDA